MRLVKALRLYALFSWESIMTNYEEQGYKAHDGMTQPVEDDTEIEYIQADGNIGVSYSDELLWTHYGLNSDILWYRESDYGS